MKIAGVVILYNPEEKWINNIMTYIGLAQAIDGLLKENN